MKRIHYLIIYLVMFVLLKKILVPMAISIDILPLSILIVLFVSGTLMMFASLLRGKHIIMPSFIIALVLTVVMFIFKEQTTVLHDLLMLLPLLTCIRIIVVDGYLTLYMDNYSQNGSSSSSAPTASSTNLTGREKDDLKREKNLLNTWATDQVNLLRNMKSPNVERTTLEEKVLYFKKFGEVLSLEIKRLSIIDRLKNAGVSDRDLPRIPKNFIQHYFYNYYNPREFDDNDNNNNNNNH